MHRGLPDITETIRALGARIGAKAAADALADPHRARSSTAIRARVAGRPRPKTLLVFGREPGTLRNIDASGGVRVPPRHARDSPAAPTCSRDIKQQSVKMSTEMVLARAPEVIIELHYGDG